MNSCLLFIPVVYYFEYGTEYFDYAFRLYIFLVLIASTCIIRYNFRKVHKRAQIDMDSYYREFPGARIENRVKSFEEEKMTELAEKISRLETLAARQKKMDLAIASKAIDLAQDSFINFVLSEGFYHSSDWRKVRKLVLTTHNNTCASCGTKYRLSVDHIKPRSRFPHLALDSANCQILCISCNSSKGAKYY